MEKEKSNYQYLSNWLNVFAGSSQKYRITMFTHGLPQRAGGDPR